MQFLVLFAFWQRMPHIWLHKSTVVSSLPEYRAVVDASIPSPAAIERLFSCSQDLFSILK